MYTVKDESFRISRVVDKFFIGEHTVLLLFFESLSSGDERNDLLARLFFTRPSNSHRSIRSFLFINLFIQSGLFRGKL